MKTRIVVLLITMLLTSCYTYKKVPRDFESFKEGELVKLVLNDRAKRGKFMGVQHDTLRFIRKSGKEEYISTTEILEIRKGKFSVLKTVLVPTSVTAGAVIGYTIVNGLNFDIDWGN